MDWFQLIVAVVGTALVILWLATRVCPACGRIWRALEKTGRIEIPVRVEYRCRYCKKQFGSDLALGSVFIGTVVMAAVVMVAVVMVTSAHWERVGSKASKLPLPSVRIEATRFNLAPGPPYALSRRVVGQKVVLQGGMP